MPGGGRLRLHESLRRILESLVPELADYAFIHLRQPGGALREVGVRHRNPERGRALTALLRQARPRMTSPEGIVGQTFREARPQRTSRGATPTPTESLERDPEAGPLLGELGPRHFMIVPLRSGEGVLGTLALARHETTAPYSHEDLVDVETFAGLAAVAIDNARLAEASLGLPGAPGDTVLGEPSVRPAPPVEEAEDQEEMDTAAWEAVKETEAVEELPGRLVDPTELLLESLGEAVSAIDLDGHITFWNAAAESLTGWARDEVLGKNIQKILEARISRNQARSALTRIKGGGTWSGPIRIMRKDGGSVSVRLTAAAVTDAAGHRLGLVAVARAKEPDEPSPPRGAMLGALASFLGGVAHTLNNRLTAIRGEAEVQLLDLPKNHELRASLEQITESADEAGSIIRQLLAYSRRQVLRPSLEDLNEVLREAEGAILEVLGDEVRLALELEADPDTVKVDASQIVEVLKVLADNARQAMPGGGVLAIRTRNATLRPGDATRFPFPVDPGRYVVISVEDSGLGIEREIQGRVFEPFFTTRASEGALGLGLSAAYGIVKQSDGYIWVDSMPGQGAVFQIYLPELDPSGEGAAPSRELRKQKVVLTVDDEEDYGERYKQILPRQGFRVVHAEHGSDALRLWARHEGRIDAVLVQMDSREVAGKLLVDRLRTIRPDLPILYTSYHVDGPGAFRGILGDREEFLKKPFEPETLVEKIRMLMEKADAD